MLLLPNLYIILYTWDQTRVVTCQQNLMRKGDGFVESLEKRYLNELCRFSDTSDDDNTRDRFFFFLFSQSVCFVIGLLLRMCKTNTNAMQKYSFGGRKSPDNRR